MDYKKKLAAYLLALAVVAIITLTIERERIVFGHIGMRPTVAHWYYVIHPGAFDCHDSSHTCPSCPVGPSDRIVNASSVAEDGPMVTPSKWFACQEINILILNQNPPSSREHPYPRRPICQRKPWDGFVRIDGKKISCAEIGPKEPKDNRQP
jgi:hypothetical protein